LRLTTVRGELHAPIERPIKVARLGLLTVVAAFVGVLLFASPASAHAELLVSNPAPNAVVASSPSAITLTFSEEIQTGSGAIRVIDAQQRLVTTAEAQHPTNTTVTLTLPKLSDGGYLVSWHVISADTHPISGAYTFAVGANSALLDPSSIPSVHASRGVGVALGIVRAIQFAVVLGAVGVVVVARLLQPRALNSLTVRRAVAMGLGPGVVTALFGIMLQSANQRGGGLGDAMSPGGWREVLDTRFGFAWLLRAGAFVLFGIMALSPVARRLARPVTDVLGVLLIAVLGYTVTYAGHSSTGRWPLVAIVADAVHLLAGALWLGGLCLVVLVAVDEARAGETAGEQRESSTGVFAARFSSVALLAVAAVAVSGGVQGWRQSGGSLSDLLGTTYGRVLGIKVAVVLVIVLIARQTRAHARSASRSSATADGPTRRVVRLVGIELVAFVAVIGLTSALVDATPPRAGASSGPIEVQKTIGTHVVDVVVDPARVGETQVHVTLFEVGTFSTVVAPAASVRSQCTSWASAPRTG
jgi:copper transport protein